MENVSKRLKAVTRALTASLGIRTVVGASRRLAGLLVPEEDCELKKWIRERMFCFLLES